MDLFRLSHEVPGESELVVSVVEHQRPAARLLRPLPPCHGALRNLPCGGAPSRVALHADRQGRADRIVVDQLARLDDGWMEEEVLEHLERTVRGFRGGDEPVRLRHRHAHRLLEGDDLSGADGLQGGLEVQVMREQDLDQVHVRARQQRVDVVFDGDAVEPPGRRTPCRTVGIGVAQRHDAGRGVGQVFDRVQIGNAPRPHEAHSDGGRAHRRSAPGPRRARTGPRSIGCCGHHASPRFPPKVGISRSVMQHVCRALR